MSEHAVRCLQHDWVLNAVINAVQSGEAISLDCQCRGDLALRHRACAIKWSRVKGDAVCDICKSTVRAMASFVETLQVHLCSFRMP